MDCVFCKIVAGEIDCAKVYEDSDVLAFLDAAPDTKGHTLVIPKPHVENIFSITEEALKKVITAAKAIALKMKESLKAEGVNINSNHGSVAGQIVPHFHLHVVPRYENDGLAMYGPRQKDKKPSSEELKKVAEQIKM